MRLTAPQWGQHQMSGVESAGWCSFEERLEGAASRAQSSYPLIAPPPRDSLDTAPINSVVSRIDTETHARKTVNDLLN